MAVSYCSLSWLIAPLPWTIPRGQTAYQLEIDWHRHQKGQTPCLKETVLQYNSGSRADSSGDTIPTRSCFPPSPSPQDTCSWTTSPVSAGSGRKAGDRWWAPETVSGRSHERQYTRVQAGVPLAVMHLLSGGAEMWVLTMWSVYHHNLTLPFSLQDRRGSQYFPRWMRHSTSSDTALIWTKRVQNDRTTSPGQLQSIPIQRRHRK